MLLPGRRDARFHLNIPSVETGNEGKPNRKPNRFPLSALQNLLANRVIQGNRLETATGNEGIILNGAVASR